MDPFAALAEPSRRRMIELLGGGERSAGALAGAFALTPAAVSQHLKVLREAGLVRVRVDGQRRIYSLDPDGLAAVDAWLDRLRGFWSGRLDALERALEDEKGDKE
jgi:DNA-binding transcriptional ArsR family regulator